MRRAAAVFVLAASLVSPARAMHPAAGPVVYAHRGGADLGPENTLGLFRTTHAAFAGVWLELDVQLAADGVLVVLHDPTLDRTTDCAGNVAARTSIELVSCNAAEAWPSWGFEPVPTLEAVLLEGKPAGWHLLIELKNIPTEPNFDPTGAAAAGALLASIDATGFPAQNVTVQSFFPTSLDQIELARPEIATMLLTTSQLPGAPPGVGFTLVENAVYSTARGYEISAPDADTIDLTADGVSVAHALGREVVVWTVNDPVEIQAMLGAGVDGVISDRPDLVYEVPGPHY